MRRLAGAVATALLTLSCTEPTEECIRHYSVEAGYSHDSDLFSQGCGDPCDSHSPDEVDCTPPSVEKIQAECYGNGAPCEGAFITKEAAICIARSEDLADGVLGPYADLVFEDFHCLCPAWDVQNVTWMEGEDREGQEILVHAVTGEVLIRGSWAGSTLYPPASGSAPRAGAAMPTGQR